MQQFMQRPKRLLLGLALTHFCLASAESAWADSKVYQEMLQSTGLVANMPSAPMRSGLINSAEAPGPHWPLATLLIGAVSVLLLLGIKERGLHHSTTGSAAPTMEVGKSAPPRTSINKEISDAANHDQ
jgi:hypothetical protein